MLSNKELATVANRLQVPLIISDIMAGEGELTDDVHYGLHEIISELAPDSALLSIALGALTIANAFEKASPGIAVLKVQCESIINDYAPLWLQNAETENVSEHEALDAISCISEDLEGLGDLLDLAVTFLQTKDKSAAAIAKILGIQARAHAIIADELFGALYMKVTRDMADEPQVAPVLAQQMNDNVIPFRAKERV